MNVPSEITFEFGARRVRLDCFFTAGAVQEPAVLLLHGASGLGGGNQYIPHLAAALAEHGLGAVVVRYFDATGTTYASDETIWESFERWLEAIRGAVDCVSMLPHVDAGKLALVGYSLGGFLAVAHASRDPRIRAVVELAGGIDPGFAEKVTHLPPTFVVHGEQDRRVPLDRAVGLQKVLERLKTPHETQFYPGEGHMLSAAAALAAFTGALGFLRQHLGVEKKAASAASEPGAPR